MTKKAPRRPKFLQGMNVRETKILFEQDGCDVFQLGDTIEMQVIGAWTDAHTKLAHEWKVNYVLVTEPTFGKRKSADFLLDFPPLRHLGIHAATQRDLSPVNKLTDLRSLWISLPARESYTGKPLDFSGMKHLKDVRVWSHRALAGLLSHPSLESLWISDEHEMDLKAIDFSTMPKLRMVHVQQAPKLRTMDLSPLEKLEELSIVAIRNLKSVMLHPKAQLRALNISGLGAWRIDWDRMGEDLEYLQLWGPLKWPLTDVLRAPNLKELYTNGIRQFPPLAFLKKLEHLRHVDIFTTPPGPKLTDDDWAVIREIEARSRPQK